MRLCNRAIASSASRVTMVQVWSSSRGEAAPSLLATPAATEELLCPAA
jgi:hypothetical protein